MNNKLFRTLVALGFILSTPVSASLVGSAGFECITQNHPECDLLGGSDGQLRLDIIDPDDDADNIVTFMFINEVGYDSSITDIYFDDSTNILDESSVIIMTSDGVSFSEPARPAQPPGIPSFTSSYSADSDSPVPSNGVDSSGEWVSFTFSLNTGYFIDDVMNALACGYPDCTEPGDLKVALHVQSEDFGSAYDKSDSFLLIPSDPRLPPNAIPVPAAVWLFASGLIAMVGVARRRK